MLVTAISTRDNLFVQGGVMLVGSFYVIVNKISELPPPALDQRLRLEMVHRRLRKNSGPPHQKNTSVEAF
jgi:ABC-type dipeptide/oligopeptide/nickel transport systems, permease components